jgi:hypothetical protein
MRLRGLCALVVAICTLPVHGKATAATALPPILVAFTQSSNVFFINLKTGARTVVTTKGRDNGKGASYPWYGWSPDGKYLALLRINNGADAKVPQNLIILDRSGTVLQTLVGGAGDFYPGWAVDADQVAYIADAGYDHGHAYFDVEAADVKGHTTRLWRSSNAQFCGIGEGAADPADGMYLRESTLDRSLRWSLHAGNAVYASPCAPGMQMITLHTGKSSVLGASQGWHSPALSRAEKLALVVQSSGTSSVPTIQLVQATSGTVLTSVGPGETPSWSVDGKAIYYQQRVAKSVVAIGTGTAAITSTVYLVSICQAPADGSRHSVIATVNAHFLGGLSQVPGSTSVIFSAVGNDTKQASPLKPGESLDAHLHKPNQPHVDIDQVDASGHVSVVVRNAGLPAVQPVLAR